ncbi:MAG: hypothetical protein IPH79_05770 [Sphingomonadales bacterium]|nr:hypothetical protein [Sphingomonadales bacterium]
MTRGNPTGEARPGGQSVSLDYDGHGRLISYARSGEATLTHSYNGMDDRIATTTLLPAPPRHPPVRLRPRWPGAGRIWRIRQRRPRRVHLDEPGSWAVT